MSLPAECGDFNNAENSSDGLFFGWSGIGFEVENKIR